VVWDKSYSRLGADFPNIARVKLARFLAEISVRARGTDRLTWDPVNAILSAVLAGGPSYSERIALAKACLAIIDCKGDIAESDLWTIGSDSLLLIDKFAAERLRLRYAREDLDFISAQLKDFIN
jgi:hypothetical protein